MITPELLSFLYQILESNYLLATIGLSTLIAGFLIFFYLNRVKKIELFTNLDVWEKLIWVFVFSLLNWLLSSIAFVFSTAILFLVLPEFAQRLFEDIFFNLSAALFIIPLTLYILHFSPTPTQVVKGFSFFLAWVWTLVLVSVMFLETFNLKIALIIFMLLIFGLLLRYVIRR